MSHPIQMKPANNENRNANGECPVEERKLFVGMVSKKCNESDVRIMFAPYGTIEECTVLRDQNGQSRGCAFVTFSTRASALNAIKALHQSQTMEGCSSPLVVKFADTQKDKEQKRLQQLNAQAWSQMNALASLAALNPQYLALLAAATAANQASAGTGSSSAVNPLSSTGAGGNTNTSALSGLGALAGLQGLGTPNSTLGLQALTGLSGMGSLNGTLGAATALSASGTAGNGVDPLSQAYSGIQQFAGPEGANLFIYHLPQEFGDQDLMQTFMPFGNVISAKVFIDKQTNLSKCFGFVSYDNPVAAQAAIQAMNGFQIGMKRLKVQLKRPKDANKPY
uniref:RRM domain-containing protein n=1 Tax=Branchiostoma floridae TaxID=7739 RepID=C3ZPV9_BRAFL|eukprot:XP_002589327.1 hypothetical protein BRAFLDRAFT_114402 [Branchiostoma floridae]